MEHASQSGQGRRRIDLHDDHAVRNLAQQTFTTVEEARQALAAAGGDVEEARQQLLGVGRGADPRPG